MNNNQEINAQYYASQPRVELAKGRVCRRCGCHLEFAHHPFCSLPITDIEVKTVVTNGNGDCGQSWVFIGWPTEAQN
jgi:hypothetical protein